MNQPLSTVPDRLVVALSPQAKESILEEWTWLVGKGKRPLLVTACGDMFIEDLLEGTVHFLNVSAPELSLVADTRQTFEMLLAEPAFVDAYMYAERVDMLRAKGLFLKKGQLYSFSTPLSLGGQITAENIDMTDAEVHFSIAGQIECQIADMPIGAPISGIKIDRMPRKHSWWKFW